MKSSVSEKSLGQRLRFRTIVFLIVIVCFFGKPASAERPNILFVMGDDLNDMVEGFGGSPDVKTPNLKRFQEEAVTFTNAHCNSIWCAPSRTSMLLGLYPATSEIYRDEKYENEDKTKNCRPMIRWLQENGYDVYGTGKVWHNGQDRKSMYTDFSVGPDFGPWAQKGGGSTTHPSLPAFNNRYFSWAPLSDIPTAEKYGEDWNGWGGFKYVDENNRDRMPDEKSADWAIGKLNESHSKPFALFVGFNRPHLPLHTPGKYFDLYDPDQLTMPPFKKGDRDDATSNSADPDNWYVDKWYEPIRDLFPDDTAGFRSQLHAYLASISFIDDQFGRLYDALKQSPYFDNTIVVFTGDQGWHIWEKEWNGKNSLWEETSRVPLIIKAPDAPGAGKICEKVVELVDLYPTINDYCDMPNDPHGLEPALDGVSLRSLLNEPEGDQWHEPELTMISKREGSIIHHGIRTDRFRYIKQMDTGDEELYDRDIDPNEWTSIADDPTYANELAEMRSTLETLLLGEPVSAISAVRHSADTRITVGLRNRHVLVNFSEGHRGWENDLTVRMYSPHGRLIQQNICRLSPVGMARIPLPDENVSQIITVRLEVGGEAYCKKLVTGL